MVANVVFVAYARSAYLALAVTSVVATLGIWRGSARGLLPSGALIVLMCGSACWLSPLISQTHRARVAGDDGKRDSSASDHSDGHSPVMWETTAFDRARCAADRARARLVSRAISKRGDAALHGMESDAHCRSAQSIPTDSGGNRLAGIGLRSRGFLFSALRQRVRWAHLE